MNFERTDGFLDTVSGRVDSTECSMGLISDVATGRTNLDCVLYVTMTR